MLDKQGREVVARQTFILVDHRRFLLGGLRHFQENPDCPPLQLGSPVPGRRRQIRSSSVSQTFVNDRPLQNPGLLCYYAARPYLAARLIRVGT